MDKAMLEMIRRLLILVNNLEYRIAKLEGKLSYIDSNERQTWTKERDQIGDTINFWEHR